MGNTKIGQGDSIGLSAGAFLTAGKTKTADSDVLNAGISFQSVFQGQNGIYSGTGSSIEAVSKDANKPSSTAASSKADDSKNVTEETKSKEPSKTEESKADASKADTSAPSRKTSDETDAVSKEEAGIGMEEEQAAQMMASMQLVLPDEASPLTEQMTAEDEPMIGDLTLTAAQDLLLTASAGLMEEVTEISGNSAEQMAELLSDLGMTKEDLLQPENMNTFAMETVGAEDSVSLLTDEDMYNRYNGMMDAFKEVLSKDSGAEELSVAELRDAVAEKKAEAPVIVVEGADSSEAKQAATMEGSTLGMESLLKNKGKNDFSGNGASSQNSDGSLFQNQMPEPMDAGNVQDMAATQETPSFADTREIANQILDYMKAQVKADFSSVEMQLHPASLGTLQINVANKNGVMTANFVTQNEQVKAALESQMVQLRDRFEEQGVKVTAIEVTVESHAFEQNLEQNQNRSDQNESQKKSRGTRRISLDELMTPEEMQNLSEEEKLTAQMMQANGQTVDYMA